MIETLYNGATEKAKRKLSPYSYPGCSHLLDFTQETYENCFCRLFDIESYGLYDKHRKSEKVMAKHLARFILVTDCGWSECEVARWGNCDRTTVIASIKVVLNLMDTDRDYKDKYEHILSKIRKNLIKLPTK
jgi:hypothetical protein